MSLGRRTKMWLKVVVFLFVILQVVPYSCSVANRMGAHECEREIEATLYIGEVCYLPSQYGTLFRLYDAQSGKLLAERTYNDLDPRIIWGDDRVYYKPGAFVMLPPTWLDRLRARLP